MTTTVIRDSAIWFKHLSDPNLQARLEGLDSEALLDLEVDGVVGQWQRMKDGADGRPTFGLRPVGAMRQVWARWYPARRDECVTIRIPQSADQWLQASAATFPEWSSADDEAAFGDL
jgi:hypothetical protein